MILISLIFTKNFYSQGFQLIFMLMTELNPFINNLAVGVGIYSLYKLDNNDFVAGLQRSVKAGVIRIVELGKNQ